MALVASTSSSLVLIVYVNCLRRLHLTFFVVYIEPSSLCVSHSLCVSLLLCVRFVRFVALSQLSFIELLFIFISCQPPESSLQYIINNFGAVASCQGRPHSTRELWGCKAHRRPGLRKGLNNLRPQT